MQRVKQFLIILSLTSMVTLLYTGSSHSACTPTASGLISRWSASGNALDTMGLNNGTVVNSVSYDVGEVGQAFSLNGASAYVDAGTSDTFNFNGGTSDFTIDAWVNPTAAQVMGIVAKDTISPYSGWSLYVYSDGKLGFGGAGVWELTSASGAVPLNTWTHVAVTKTGSVYRLYVNGVQAAYRDYGNLQTSSASLKIGTSYSSAYFFTGLIDEVDVYNRALSASEIQAIYNASSNGQCKP